MVVVENTNKKRRKKCAPSVMDQLPLGKASNMHTKPSICRKGRQRDLSIKSVCTDNSSYTAVRGIDSVGGGLRKHTWEILVRKRRGHLGGLKSNWWVWAYNHYYVLCKCASTAALDWAQDRGGSKKGALKSKWIKIIWAKGSTYSTASSSTFCWTA